MVAGDPRERDQGKRLLVLGAGPAQLGLLAAARARELHVIAVDREPSAPGFRYADRRAIVSTEDESSIERLAGAERVDGLIARWLVHDPNAQPVAEVLAGLAAVIGHNWSIFIQLRGGRGVVVSHAVFILICWPAALITTVIGVIVLAISRIVSLASLTGAVAGVVVLAIFVVLFHYPLPYLVYGILAAALIWLRHIDNIQRLLAGTERRLGQKAQPLP